MWKDTLFDGRRYRENDGNGAMVEEATMLKKN